MSYDNKSNPFQGKLEVGLYRGGGGGEGGLIINCMYFLAYYRWMGL